MGGRTKDDKYQNMLSAIDTKTSGSGKIDVLPNKGLYIGLDQQDWKRKEFAHGVRTQFDILPCLKTGDSY